MDAQMQALVAAMGAERGRHAEAGAFYRELAGGQRPGAVVICCSDSRAAPEHIARADPGTLFVERSVAGVVPPPPGVVERDWLKAYAAATRCFGLRQLSGAWYGAWATIEYPVMHLEVANVLVLGHSGCGGIALACRRRGDQATLHDTDCWVDMVRPALRPVLRQHPPDTAGRAAEEAAVLWSRANLLRHPGIAGRVRLGLTNVYGAHYDIASGEVTFYDPERSAFVALS